MLTIEVAAGESIDATIQVMTAMANGLGEAVQAKFNDVGLIAEPGTDPALLMRFWQSEMARRAAEDRGMAAGKKATADAEARKATDQQTADRLMADLPTLDFTDLDTLIDWMEVLADPSDQVGVFIPTAAIIAAFNDHGFVANANTGEDFDGEDRDNFARYLIGQGLSCLSSVGAIHGIFHKFAADWRAKLKAAP